MKRTAKEEEERLQIIRRYRRLIEVWDTRKDTIDRWMVRKAFRLAADAHRDMRRKSGEPFIFHPLEVATIAAGEIGLGRTSIISALLHDTVEDTDLTLTDVQGMFGEEVARIIDGLTKIDEISDSTTTAQAETLKKIIFTLSDDVRVILIKLADRLHNMRTMEVMPREKQLKIASETLFIYAPLAYRLGLFPIKSELEDLSFKFSQPQIYRDIKEKMNDERVALKEYFEEFTDPIRKELDKQKTSFKINYNEKTTYSVWKKMQENEMPFEEINDTYSVDVILDAQPEKEKLECWGTYALVTTLYKPNNERLHDWISTPKANGYEAIHTTVMGPHGRWVDVHIRSRRMDEIALKGYAAYWKYKSKTKLDSGLDEWLSRTRELLNESDEEAIAFINSFKQNLFSEEIFVFTPDGEMINLPSGATVLDFAYAIHTDLGNHCIGANVNHRLVPINYQVKSGDQVEIITSRIRQPNEDWFKYVVTARAKSRIKNAIRKERKAYREEGEKKLDTYLKQLKIEGKKHVTNKLIQGYQLSGIVDLYYFIAKEKITLKDIKEIISQNESQAGWMRRNLLFPFVKPRQPANLASDKNESENEESAIEIEPNNKSKKINTFDYSVSSCCNPIPGDDVIGLILPSEPIQIHKTNCDEAIRLMSQYGKNIVKAKWKQKEGIAFVAGLKITAMDKIGFIKQVTGLIADDFHLNIRSFNLESIEGLINLNMTLYINNTTQLKQL
ncbi:MAG: bifunctional (p)ppGpp synthetase/guanosine-3',5'-bis(diphosphate) 3'-pyrophosphohydrolase, partial [Chlorobi bacterium]|nr:bifunctional (p)ppGpp synthetase/guanosine-3',5'-bis(diphosphate) 3'-pyrophosphohydrolase [Chlorobiota bacterium]